MYLIRLESQSYSLVISDAITIEVPDEPLQSPGVLYANGRDPRPDMACLRVVLPGHYIPIFEQAFRESLVIDSLTYRENLGPLVSIGTCRVHNFVPPIPETPMVHYRQYEGSWRELFFKHAQSECEVFFTKIPVSTRAQDLNNTKELWAQVKRSLPL